MWQLQSYFFLLLQMRLQNYFWNASNRNLETHGAWTLLQYFRGQYSALFTFALELFFKEDIYKLLFVSLCLCIHPSSHPYTETIALLLCGETGTGSVLLTVTHPISSQLKSSPFRSINSVPGNSTFCSLLCLLRSMQIALCAQVCPDYWFAFNLRCRGRVGHQT